jgi:DNA-directed RNA polymerase subunit M/transcription elongation factor TFIIS
MFCTCGTQCTYVETSNKNAIYKCSVCSNEYEITGEHTLLEEEKAGIQSDAFLSILQSVSYDVTNLRKKVPCMTCGRPVMSYVQVGKKSQNYYACKCGAISMIS